MQKLIPFLLISLFLLPVSVRAESVEKIVDRMDAVTSSFEDYKGTGVLSPRADGEEIPIGVYVVRSETDHRFKTVVRELQNPHTTLLTYVGVEEDQQWTYNSTLPRPMRTSVNGQFLGSEFLYEDIALFWEVRRFTYTDTSKEEPCGDDVCVVLKRVPRFKSAYDHQLVLVDEEYRIRETRSFVDGEQEKIVTLKQYQKYGGIFLPRVIHVQSGGYESYIHVDAYELDANMNERHFSSRNIGDRKWSY